MSRSRHCFQSQCIIVPCHAMCLASLYSYHFYYSVALWSGSHHHRCCRRRKHEHWLCTWCVRVYVCIYAESYSCIANKLLRQRLLDSPYISFNRLWCQPLNWYILCMQLKSSGHISYVGYCCLTLNEMKVNWRVKCRSYQVRNVGFWGKLHELKEITMNNLFFFVLTCPTAIFGVVLYIIMLLLLLFSKIVYNFLIYFWSNRRLELLHSPCWDGFWPIQHHFCCHTMKLKTIITSVYWFWLA